MYVRTCVSITVDRQSLGFVLAKLILGYGIDREHSSNEDGTGGTVNRVNPPTYPSSIFYTPRHPLLCFRLYTS